MSSFSLNLEASGLSLRAAGSQLERGIGGNMAPSNLLTLPFFFFFLAMPFDKLGFLEPQFLCPRKRVHDASLAW